MALEIAVRSAISCLAEAAAGHLYRREEFDQTENPDRPMPPGVADISVITLVKNRSDHLGRLIAGVRASEVRPREIIVVDMSETPIVAKANDFATIVVAFPGPGLPLAAARNRGAAVANGHRLLFLDVDCIPRRTLIAAIDQALCVQNELICAEIRYLGPGTREFCDDTALMDVSVLHPHRHFPSHGMRRESNAGLFWSLAFGIRRETFFKLEGFDETYEGYGAEDTDFGFRARAAGLPLALMGGTGAFHQYHGVISPPLQHLADIVKNANRFYERWNVWPMQDWLTAFAGLGLVEQQADRLVLFRLPTNAELQSATQPPSVYF